MKNFKKAYEKAKAAEKAMREAMIKDMPVGATIFYSLLLIRTPHGRQIWIDAVKVERVIL